MIHALVALSLAGLLVACGGGGAATSTASTAPAPATPPPANPASAPTPMPPAGRQGVPEQPLGPFPAWVAQLPAPLRTVHVAPLGSGVDGTGETEANPVRGLQRAVDAARPGDRLLLLPGEYREPVRIRQGGLTLESQQRHAARIVVGMVDESRDSSAVQIDPGAHGTRLIGLDISGGYYYGVSLETRWDWGTADRSGATRVVLSQLRVHHTGRDGIKLKPLCDDVLIERTEISHTGQRDDSNSEGIDNVNASRMVVQDSWIHDIATTGLYFKGGARDVVVQRNLVERTGIGRERSGGGILVGFDTSPEFFSTGTNPQYHEAIDAVVVNNIVRDTAHAGIGVFATDGARIEHNTLDGVATQGQAALHFGLSLQDYEAGAGRPPSRRVQFVGNWVRSAHPQAAALEIRHAVEPQPVGTISAYTGMPTSDRNAWWALQGEPRFSDRRPASALDAVVLTAWRAATAQDAQSLLDATAPQAADSWRPPAALADRGAPTPWSAVDFFGRPRSGAADIGAVER